MKYMFKEREKNKGVLGVCRMGITKVAYHNWVTVTLNLTSVLIFRNYIESGAYLLYSLR